MSTPFYFSFGAPGTNFFGPAPIPAPAAPEEIIGRAPAFGSGSHVTLFRGQGESVAGCTSCDTTKAPSISQGDIMSPEGESKLCGKCLFTWILAGLLALFVLCGLFGDGGKE